MCSISTLIRSCLLLAACAFLGPQIGAQTLLDSFDDGFDPTLGWQGDLLAFNGEGGRLVLREQRPVPASSARVWVPAATRDSACWMLNIDQRFSASTSNRVRWWLAADRALTQAGLQGHYFQFGGISGNDDALELFAVSGGTTTLVAGGRAGLGAADPLELQVQVCAHADQSWTWRATNNAGAVLDSARGSSPRALNGTFAGLEVAFTSTRVGLLSFDDFQVAPVFRDVQAPQLVLAKAESIRSVLVLANEPLSAANADTALYTVNGRRPLAAEVLGDTVRLTLAEDLPTGRSLVTVASLTDLAGNTSLGSLAQFDYQAPRQLQRYELLITEIMADPSPVVGLPEVEYLEVFNASNAAIDLARVRLDNGRLAVDFPSYTLAAGEYRAFTREALMDGRFTQMTGLPTLTNSGATLRLLNSDGTVIDEVTYSDRYYRSGTSDGGYALERSDVSKPCLLGASNLRSSLALAGGTPSAPNSDFPPEELQPLRIESVIVAQPTLIQVTTNRALTNPTRAFRLSDGRAFMVMEGATPGLYTLTLDQPISMGDLFELSLTLQAGSCVGGEARDLTPTTLGLADESRPSDWQLNEIMYDPLSGQGRWVELANVSDRLLSLDALTLARAMPDSSVISLFVMQAQPLVPAGRLVVLAADPATLLQQFPQTSGPLVAQTTVPTVTSNECLMLFDAVSEEIYFHVCYDDSWHNQAYASTDGVSLERISLDRAAQDPDNWTSAASTSGFGTPTSPNSQAADPALAATEVGFTLLNERLSPDGDGFEDLLSVQYVLDESELLARFMIVDPQGRPVFEPTEDRSLGRDGIWTWDGTNNDGEVVGIGTYIVRIEYWSPEQPAKRTYLPFSVLRQL